MTYKKKAFTLIELLVVIAIIGILSTLAVVSLQNARKSARDAKRIADVKQMQTALELYFNDWQKYPVDVISGNQIASGTDHVYMVTVPSAPTPADSTTCSTVNDYDYYQVGSGESYYLQFCLGNSVGTLSAGIQCAFPGGIIATTTSCF